MCPICSGEQTREFFALRDQPVLIGALWDSAAAAKACASGSIALRFCNDCGFIWNSIFDDRKIAYDQNYENSLHFSATFQNYTEQLIDRLVATYDLRGKHLIDIGGGKGDFLTMLCEAGPNFGHGFDPSYEGDRVPSEAADRITWYQDYYSESHAQIQADFISTRFVFEHIAEPLAFLDVIRRNITDFDRTVLYFEVPNVDLIVRQFSVWDIIYEHCSYFSPESLHRCFEIAGFEVLNITETYQKQFLAIEARATNAAGRVRNAFGNVSELARQVDTFQQEIASKFAEWRANLETWRARQERVAIWGAGAKAVGMLNMLSLTDEFPVVVDINPHKHGKHLSGGGQRIIAPQDLVEFAPDTIVLTNPIYRNEIEASLASMELSPRLVAA